MNTLSLSVSNPSSATLSACGDRIRSLLEIAS
jgi:hypothetical protein